jgi:hypothetical protein
MNTTEKSEETVESTEVSFEKNKPSAARGLLSLAIKKAANVCKGLLALASKYKKSALVRGKGLLDHASKYRRPAFVSGRGLLALAGKREKQILARGKGLLAHACKMEIKADDEDNDQIANINVVSPFSSMFSSLSEK